MKNRCRRTNRPGNQLARRRASQGRRTASRSLFAEHLEDRRLLSGVPFPYHNSLAPLDVTRDWVLSPRDALQIINQLNNGGSRPLDLVNAPDRANRTFVDVNADNFLSPLDALLVINNLNRGEGLDGDIVSFRLEVQDATGQKIEPLKDAHGNIVYDADGDPIVPVMAGEEFRLQLYVHDLRDPAPNGNGVFAATVDIAYSTADAFTLGGVKPDDFTTLSTFRSYFKANAPYSSSGLTVWPSARNIDLDGVANEFDELATYAGVTDRIPNGTSELPFVYVTLTADDVAEFTKVTFSVNPSEFDPPGNDILVMGSDDPVNMDFVDFGLPVHLTVVRPINAQDDVFPVPPGEILEDSGPVDLDVLANDYLLPGSTGTLALAAAGLTQPANGQVSVVGNKVRYKPNADFFGTDTFTYTAVDGLGNSDTATVTVTVSSVNDPPVAVNDAFTVLEDSGANVLDVLANDNGGPPNEDQALTIDPATLTQPAHGTVALVASNTRIEYTPAANFFGTDTFQYSVIDSDGLGSNRATVTITVENVNDPPTAVDDVVTGILEDSTANPIDVLANDSPGPGEGTVDTLTIVSTQSFSAGGSATIRADGRLLFYTPAADFFGTETFSYTVRDSGGLTATAQVTVHVTNVNDPVTAADDSFYVGEFTTDNELDVLANDSPGPHEETVDDLVIIAVTVPDANGTVEIAPDGKSLIYAPDPTALGPYTETFQYTVTDGPTQDTATVTVLVEPVTRPRARNDRFTVLEDSLATDPANTLRVLDNDLFNEGANRTLFQILDDPGHTLGPLHGVATVVGDAVRYQPDPDFFGTDTFTYIIDDDFVDAEGNPSQPSIAVVTITVTPVNDPPQANPDSFDVDESQAPDTAYTLDVLANDNAGPPNEDQTLTIVEPLAQPAHGTVTVKLQGGVPVIEYRPQVHFVGVDTFPYAVRDSEGLVSELATVTITVHNVDDPPTAGDDEYLGVPEHSVDYVLAVTDNDSPGPNDASAGDTITIVSVQGFSRGGSATISVDGKSLLYTPARRPEAVETFTYTIEDSHGGTATATVTVHIVDENDDPTAVDDELMALKDFADQVLNVLENDSIWPDPVGSEELTIIGLGPSAETTIPTLHGTATIAADGKSILYTPTPGFESAGADFDQFTYTVDDGRGGTATATVTVDVIDAVPSDISGVVYLDVNNNGIKDDTEVGLAGVEVTLTGTNVRGQAVNLTAKTDVNGEFRFAGVLPTAEGNLDGYTIAAAQPKFLIDGIDTILDATVGDDLNPGVAENDQFTGIQLGLWGTGRAEGNYLFGERGLSSQFITIAQYLASTRKGLAAATNLAGDDYWFTVLQGWEGIRSCHVQLASDLATAEVTIVDVNGQTHTRTVDYRKYHLAGDRTTGEYVIFFNGSAADLGFDLPGDRVVANDANPAEGEADADAITMYAADFARAADKLFADGDWA